MKVVEHSWREFFDIHPAAAFFHEFSSDEQLQALTDDIDKREVLLAPIHTASVVGKAKPFVIDGISRLDAAEKTGRQIVSENGDWMGMLSNVGSSRSVIDHPGMIDKEVWDLVISLNLKRRHHTTGQLSEIADMLATRPAGRPWPKNKSPEIHNYAPTAAKTDQTSEIQFDSTPTVEQAAKMVGVSKSSVHDFRKVKKEAPEKVVDIRSGKLSPSKAASELPAKKSKRRPRKELSFADEVRKKWTQWLNRFQHAQRKEVIAIVVEWIGTN
jgi:hypothetical protein